MNKNTNNIFICFANCEIYIIFTWCICLLKGIKMKPDLLNINGILGWI